MTRDIFPAYSKTRVRNAGDAVKRNALSEEDVAVIENWRASHTYILNTFQATLRNRSKGKKILVAQRLKRRPTIFDKLIREPTMSLSKMHDIAGCRLIFQSIDELVNFREAFLKFRAKHLRKNAHDEYDYILRPKASGYRGIHDVYQYCVNSEGGKKWNGLLLELQYRTIYQHAWATAVEIAGAVTENQPKFNKGDERYKDFFRLTSEIIARVYEGETSCMGHLSDGELRDAFNSLESKIHLFQLLSSLPKLSAVYPDKRNVILILSEDMNDLKALAFENRQEAVDTYFQLEKSMDGKDIVLVRADDHETIRSAYRNYFADTEDFIRLVEDGLGELAK